jgi:hypothetical protein
LNNSAILNGTIPKNSSQYYLIKYNVSNMPSGTYEAHASLPNFNLVLNASKTVYIKPYSDFFFPGDNPVTEIVGNYSFINIIIENIGNTPLKMNWSLPEFINISYANLLYKQNFNLLPEQNYTIPTNLSLTGKYQKNISFAFTGSYKNYTETKSYYTTLIKPYTNMSFYNVGLKQINSTLQLWSASIKNYNDVPVNLVFKFELYVNGSTFYYSKDYTLPVNASKVEIYLPKSTVENVKVSYVGSNDSDVTQSVFAAPKPPIKISLSYVLDTLGYVIFTAIAVVLLALLHIRFKRKEKKGKNGNNK